MPHRSIAIWALTPNAAQLAARLAAMLRESVVFLSRGLEVGLPVGHFERLAPAVEREFRRHRGHVFIMSTGIVVRMIAPWIRHKTEDPAVVVLDETARHAVSLLSGHLGGANALAREVAALLGATAVITTATDLNQVPAIDVIAAERGLSIENPAAIKAVSMTLLRGGPIGLHDPFGILGGALPAGQVRPLSPGARRSRLEGRTPGIFVDDICVDLPAEILVLRPGSLAAGLGCNRGTAAEEMEALLAKALEGHGLAAASLSVLASVDLKADEAGLHDLARRLELPLRYFSRQALNGVGAVPTPSAAARKHIGVHSVCEAAALLATDKGTLVVTKQKTRNATVAIARRSSMSWV
jgi:cobalt-precorrin 5A hydrolase